MDNPTPSETIIRNQIQQLKDGNDRANADLNANLQFLRDKLSPGTFATQSIPLAGTDQDGLFMYQRQQLMTSLFTSEVVAAAVLDPVFKERVQAEAEKILIDKGVLEAPAVVVVEPTGPTGPTGPAVQEPVAPVGEP